MTIRNFFKHRCARLALVLFTPSLAFAQQNTITVRDAWIRALPRSVPSGGYFTLHNGEGKTITLVGANSPACGMLMLHKSSSMGGMSNMQDVEAIDIPAGGTLKFAPGSYHLMCMDAGPQIKPGSHIAVTLAFKDGRNVTSEFEVRSAAGK